MSAVATTAGATQSPITIAQPTSALRIRMAQ
jgi:hypothetical protein